jgi:hypothetical protein
MSTLRRLIASTFVVLFVLLAGCGTTIPSAATATPNASAAAAADAAARDAYNAAICPVFDAILILDPRLLALRGTGAGSDPAAIDAEEVDAVIAELGTALTDLDAVPDWEAGRNLRYQLVTALHAIRARLLQVARDPTARGSLDHLAELPFIASVAMDRAYGQAVRAGHTCQAGS